MFTFFFVLSDSVWAGKHPLVHCLFKRSCDNRGNRALPNILWHCAWVTWSDDWLETHTSLGDPACCFRGHTDCQSRTCLAGWGGAFTGQVGNNNAKTDRGLSRYVWWVKTKLTGTLLSLLFYIPNNRSWRVRSSSEIMYFWERERESPERVQLVWTEIDPAVYIPHTFSSSRSNISHLSKHTNTGHNRPAVNIKHRLGEISHAHMLEIGW